MKSPLRAVDGFSLVLLEEKSQLLDGESLRLLNIIRRNTQKMGNLIADLLALSKMGKKEIQYSTINVESLVKKIVNEIESKYFDRKIKFVINQAPKAFADNDMIKVVLINLLSNAVKFTKDKEEAIIEFGGKKKSNETEYYVKDNGKGFDMKYSEKLFGVFQKLHPHDEYEGTGIGLALIKRIVQKHNGRVWAEGKINKGASFYFTLPIKKS